MRHPRTEALKGMHSEDTYKTFLLPRGEPAGPSLHQDPDPYNHCVLSHSPGDDGYRWEGGTLLETQEPLESEVVIATKVKLTEEDMKDSRPREEHVAVCHGMLSSPIAPASSSLNHLLQCTKLQTRGTRQPALHPQPTSALWLGILAPEPSLQPWSWPAFSTQGPWIFLGHSCSK